jgi:hypothetical protein
MIAVFQRSVENCDERPQLGDAAAVLVASHEVMLEPRGRRPRENPRLVEQCPILDIATPLRSRCYKSASSARSMRSSTDPSSLITSAPHT